MDVKGQVGGLWGEFRGFALKGNLIDLAVAVVIGGAFGGVVNSLVKNIIMPALSYLTPGKPGYQSWKFGRVEVGAFLGELVNFAIVAAAMFFLVVKVLGVLQRVAGKTSDEPATKDCPYCLSKIPFKAVKCGQCTSDLNAEPAAAAISG